ncbi:MAG: hypothetical protein GY749_29300 [Desulfobacteraceae bacterium]|nr:hypothetical protein [Desulfobacteraceae bacterium]
MSEIIDRENKKLRFKDCTQQLLEETFQLKQAVQHQALQRWVTADTEVTEFEQANLDYLGEYLRLRGHTWNETELRDQFIGPMIGLVNFDSDEFRYFAERNLSGIVDNWELSGRVDAMIAQGRWEPKKIYFCMNEYKKEKEPEGDPGAQALAAMLVAQEQNANQQIPVYGLYVKGKLWYFMILSGKEYAITEPYTASRPDIVDIFKILKILKRIICDILK